MPLIDVEHLPILEPRPGWRGQFFHSPHMTFAYYSIAPSSSLHEHSHEEEEVWHVIEGELELTLSGTAQRLQAGQAAVVPGGEPHSVRALRACRVIVVDHPVRASVGGVDTGSPTLS